MNSDYYIIDNNNLKFDFRLFTVQMYKVSNFVYTAYLIKTQLVQSQRKQRVDTI